MSRFPAAQTHVETTYHVHWWEDQGGYLWLHDERFGSSRDAARRYQDLLVSGKDADYRKYELRGRHLKSTSLVEPGPPISYREYLAKNGEGGDPPDAGPRASSEPSTPPSPPSDPFEEPF